MKINIPIGSEINKIENNVKNNIIKIRIPNSIYWVQGEREPGNFKWTTYMIDPTTNYKEVIKKGLTTEEFALFSGITLKTPFPFTGKEALNSEIIKKFIKKLIKTKKNGNKQSNNKSIKL